MKNKLLTALFLIFLAMVAYPQTDLIWYGPIYINPAAPATGDVVTFTATVKATLGNSQPFQVVGGIDGTQLLSTTGPALVKATKKSFSFNWTAVTGNHTVYFDIDPNHISGDINFKNNHIEVNFTVDTGSTPQPPPRRRGRDQLPNLVIKNVTWNPQTFIQGDKLDFQITVANIGNVPTPMSFTTLDINGTVFMHCNVNALQPGDTDTILASGIVNMCPVKVIIKADADGLITESNEGDNEWSKKIDCAPAIIQPAILPVTTDINIHQKNPKGPGNPKNPSFSIGGGIPNLVVSEVSWTPKTFPEGQKVTFSYRSKNIGNGIASPRPSLSFTAENGQAKVEAPGAPGTTLYPGNSTPPRKFVWTSKCNTKVTIAVDDDKRVVETDETDNYWTHTFYGNECTPVFIPEPPTQNLPNLHIDSSHLSPLKTSFGTGTVYNFDIGDISVDIRFTVKNSGNVPAPASKYQLLVNNKVIITDYITLGANQQKQIGWYATVKCGSIFKLILDVDNTVAESSEFDNSTTIGPWPKCN
jgi:subtilase family serine protease